MDEVGLEGEVRILGLEEGGRGRVRERANPTSRGRLVR